MLKVRVRKMVRSRWTAQGKIDLSKQSLISLPSGLLFNSVL